MAQPTDDNKQHAQASVKEDGSQKRKREGPHSKSPEDLLNEEVTEIMDEFTTLGSYYQLVDKIGEGTFSSVYKAVDVRHEYYDNSNWDLSAICNGYERINLDQSSSMSQDEEALDHHHESESQEPQKHYVALKRIYVTSSPERITSEIEILHQLSGSECVVPLITAFRQMDQVMVVLPYLAHDDFRVFYRSMEMDDIRCYFRCLFTALKHVHKNRILHRDIKPGNFLYNYKHRTGMLVDFGLAQREDETRPSSPPPTTLSYRQNHNASHSVLKSRQTNVPLSNPVRANRAGTRGFRAPEVLLRVVHQTVAIDVWAVGVILISILTARFPFFQSEDDADALIEIATIFGLREMKDCASLHNRTFHTNVTTIPKTRLSFMKLCMALNKQKAETWGEQNVRDAVDLLEKCLVLDCSRRISAEEALDHPFFHPSASSPRS
ncbi:kinase-like domain-containing protein [Umbelopsis sp. AD052]|nr:kinase-like domain-containing protein [Umbelopsis sp. AD052]